MISPADILEARSRRWRALAAESREARDIKHARVCDCAAERCNVEARSIREAERVAAAVRAAVRAPRPTYRTLIRALLGAGAQ